MSHKNCEREQPMFRKSKLNELKGDTQNTYITNLCLDSKKPVKDDISCSSNLQQLYGN